MIYLQVGHLSFSRIEPLLLVTESSSLMEQHRQQLQLDDEAILDTEYTLLQIDKQK
jgi:hypothetical protein